MREIAQSDTPASVRRRSRTRRWSSTTPPAPTPTRRRRSTSASGLPPLRAALDRRARRHRASSPGPTLRLRPRARWPTRELAELRFDLAAHAAPRQGRRRTSRRCTTPAAASSRRRWSTSPSARTCSATSCARYPRCVARASIRARPSAPRIPEFITPGVRARRGGARPRHHPGQHQPPRSRADDHRPQLPGEDQRQHRQLGGRPRRSRRRSRRWPGRSAGAPTR